MAAADPPGGAGSGAAPAAQPPSVGKKKDARSSGEAVQASEYSRFTEAVWASYDLEAQQELRRVVDGLVQGALDPCTLDFHTAPSRCF